MLYSGDGQPGEKADSCPRTKPKDSASTQPNIIKVGLLITCCNSIFFEERNPFLHMFQSCMVMCSFFQPSQGPPVFPITEFSHKNSLTCPSVLTHPSLFITVSFSLSFCGFLKEIFRCGTFLKPFIHYNIACAFGFGFLAMRHVGLISLTRVQPHTPAL